MKREYSFSLGLRLAHWIRAFAIVILVVTGFYIAYVFVSPEVSSEPVLFLNAKMRAVHQISGFVLLGCFIFKFYLFCFDKISKKERASFYDFISPKQWIKQIKCYLLFGAGPKLRGVYNPVQFMAYIGFYILLAFICVTGFVLYAHVYHDGFAALIYTPARAVELWLGGLANVRVLHHISMWLIMIFALVHVYMVLYNNIRNKDGSIDGIISGYV